MHIEINSLLSAILFLCGTALVFVLLPLATIWRAKSTYNEWQQGFLRWENRATYRFISNPKNKLIVQIVGAVGLLFILTLSLGLVGLVIYFAVISGSRGWIILLLFFIPFCAGAVLAVFTAYYVIKMRKKV